MSQDNLIRITVNEKNYSLPQVAGEMLSTMLRERLHLTGTKIGCNEAECGACTVLVDGRPILSCTYPAAKAAGRQVVTIEGLARWLQEPRDKASGRQLHPLQDAFIQYGAVQCGFCIPGQIMTSYALLLRNQDPTEDDIRHALKDTLCRCAGYPAIVGAIRAAAASLRTGQPVVPPQVILSAHPGQAVGQSHIRPDAVEKVTGEAVYSDDLQFEGMLHARVKRAMLPAAVVWRVDTARARALSGVAAVLTAADIPGEHLHGLVINDWPSLVGIGEHVRYVGDAIRFTKY